MKTSHTPGQWEAHGQAVYSGDIYIAQCWDETSRELDAYSQAVGDGDILLPEHGAEGQANARLIAAAPELLKALRGLIDAVDGTVGDLELRQMLKWGSYAREVVLKATKA